MSRVTSTKTEQRSRRHARIRARVIGSAARPRLAFFKSNRFVSAQLIDDASGKTIASAHGREFKGAQSVQAQAVGEAIAKRAKEAGIGSVVFDRAGYRYAGLVEKLASAAREGGLAF